MIEISAETTSAGHFTDNMKSLLIIDDLLCAGYRTSLKISAPKTYPLIFIKNDFNTASL